MQNDVTRDFSVAAADGALLRVREFTARPGADEAATVVLAHGWTLTHASWLPVVERLRASTGARVVVYDQRGHGASTPGPGHPSVRTLGDDLAAVLAVAAPSGPVVLGGHSMGGMSVLAYAGQHPEDFRSRVRGSVLVSAAAGELSPRRGAMEVLVMQALARAPRLPAGRAITLRSQQALLFGDDPRPEDVRATRDQVAATRLPTFGRFHRALAQHDEADAAAHFADIPTRILVGEKDRLTPVHLSRRLAELMPHATLEVLPGRGHMLTYEAPGVLAGALAAQLRAPQADPR